MDVVVRPGGIEPPFLMPQISALPLSYGRILLKARWLSSDTQG